MIFILFFAPTITIFLRIFHTSLLDCGIITSALRGRLRSAFVQQLEKLTVGHY